MTCHLWTEPNGSPCPPQSLCKTTLTRSLGLHIYNADMRIILIWLWARKQIRIFPKMQTYFYIAGAFLSKLSQCVNRRLESICPAHMWLLMCVRWRNTRWAYLGIFCVIESSASQFEVALFPPLERAGLFQQQSLLYTRLEGEKTQQKIKDCFMGSGINERFHQ